MWRYMNFRIYPPGSFAAFSYIDDKAHARLESAEAAFEQPGMGTGELHCFVLKGDSWKMRPDFWVRVLCFAQGSADFGYAVKDPGGLMRAVLNIVKSRFAGEDTYRVYSGIFPAAMSV